MSLTAVILTKQADSSLRKNLNLLTFADEILVITDQIPVKNLSLPKKINILHHSLNHNFAAHRNYALSKAKGGWILFLDEDELINSRLASEIKSAIKNDTLNGYYLPRYDSFYNQTLKFGETGKISLLRLGKRGEGQWIRPVHEKWQIKPPTGKLTNPILHQRQNLTTGFIERMILYCPIDARTLEKENKPFSYFRLFVNPISKFFLNYVLKLGFADGLLGLFHAYLMSLQSLTVRIYQWEKNYS